MQSKISMVQDVSKVLRGVRNYYKDFNDLSVRPVRQVFGVFDWTWLVGARLRIAAGAGGWWW